MERYYIQSEHVRGERRVWYVVKRGSHPKFDEMVSDSTRTREESAQKLCDRLNQEADHGKL